VTSDARERFFRAAPTARAGGGVAIGTLRLRTPVMPASGCFGPELGSLLPTAELGAVVTKTVFADVRGGNPAHRLDETDAGMVNSVGIPSLGAAGYLRRLHPAYRRLGAPVIISAGAHRTREYAPLVADLGDAGDAYELNVSCPNLDRTGTDIGADPHAVAEVVADVRRVTRQPLIVKLPPMASSIAECAIAAESAGADAVCVSNSIPVLPLRGSDRRPALGNAVGGLSGPGVKPIVQRLVWLAAEAVSIPVIACGGVESASDALDYFSLGAVAVQVGTATFARPFAMVEIIRELDRIAAAGERGAA
jgi:dihydroorotate dehydrogenase (NAD+) catalytic subunit